MSAQGDDHARCHSGGIDVATRRRGGGGDAVANCDRIRPASCEVVANCDHLRRRRDITDFGELPMSPAKKQSLIPVEQIEPRILLLRGQRVILDADLAELYGATTKRLNEQVKRNRGRFPDDFAWQVTAEEKAEVVTNCDHLARLKFSRNLPHAFTEHGALMAASVLNTPLRDRRKCLRHKGVRQIANSWPRTRSWHKNWLRWNEKSHRTTGPFSRWWPPSGDSHSPSRRRRGGSAFMSARRTNHEPNAATGSHRRPRRGRRG